MKKTLLTGTFTLGAIAAVSLLQTAPAQAFTFDQGNLGMTIKEEDVGDDFWAVFDGRIDGTTEVVEGLTSQALFTLKSFDASQIVFDILVENTSTNPITASILSQLGFQSAKKISNTVVTNKIGNFGDYINKTSFGGALAFRESAPRESAFFTATIDFENDISDGLYLNNFGVKYKGIRGTISGELVENLEGTGVGKVPTPALLPGLIGMGISALRKNKQEKQRTA
jgi:hypothetical protein